MAVLQRRSPSPARLSLGSSSPHRGGSPWDGRYDGDAASSALFRFMAPGGQRQNIPEIRFSFKQCPSHMRGAVGRMDRPRFSPIRALCGNLWLFCRDGPSLPPGFCRAPPPPAGGGSPWDGWYDGDADSSIYIPVHGNNGLKHNLPKIRSSFVRV